MPRSEKMDSRYGDDAPRSVPFTGGRLGDNAAYEYGMQHARAAAAAAWRGTPKAYGRGSSSTASGGSGTKNVETTTAGEAGSRGRLLLLSTKKGEGVEPYSSASYGAALTEPTESWVPGWDDDNDDDGLAMTAGGMSTLSSSTRDNVAGIAEDQNNMTENCSCARCFSERCLLRDPTTGDFSCVACNTAALACTGSQ